MARRSIFITTEHRNRGRRAVQPIREHILLRWASQFVEVQQSVHPLLTRESLENVLAQLPDAWLLPVSGAETPAANGLTIDYFCAYRSLRRMAAAF